MIKRPTKCFCPYCNNNIITMVEHKNGYLSYLMSILTLLTIGLLPSVVVIPFILVATKTLVHKFFYFFLLVFIKIIGFLNKRCAICFNELGTDGKVFTFFNFHEKVQFKL